MGRDAALPTKAKRKRGATEVVDLTGTSSDEEESPPRKKPPTEQAARAGANLARKQQYARVRKEAQGRGRGRGRGRVRGAATVRRSGRAIEKQPSYTDRSVFELSRPEITQMIDAQTKSMKDDVAPAQIKYDNGTSGKGLVAQRRLPAGFSIVYYGLPAGKAEMKRWKTIQRKQTHSLQVDNDLAIKGKFRHNKSEHIALAALATHSSTGNMVLRSDRSVFPELVATRPIAKGEQLSFDYGSSYFAVPRGFSRGSTG